MSLIFTLAFILWWAKENPEYADWLAGVGTVGSLTFLAWQYVKDRKAKAELERVEQASQISVYHESHKDRHYLTINNTSHLPIYAVVPFTGFMGPAFRTYLVVDHMANTLSPYVAEKMPANRNAFASTIIIPGITRFELDSSVIEQSLDYHYNDTQIQQAAKDSAGTTKLFPERFYGVAFTDSKGKRWTRNINGLLQEGDSKLVKNSELFDYAFPIAPELFSQHIAAPVFTTPMDIPVAIQKLAKLRAEGSLTDEEFSTKKIELLKRM